MASQHNYLAPVLAAVVAGVAGISFLPVAALVAGFLGCIPVDSVSNPPGWEEKIAHEFVEASLEKRAEGLVNPLKGTDEELLAGMRTFRDNCSGCHGDYMEPSKWGSTGFYPRVPQFGAHSHGEHDAHDAHEQHEHNAAEMFVAVKYGIRYSGMGAWNGMLTDEQIWQTVTFLSRLDSLPPSVEEQWKKNPQQHHH